MRYHRTALLRCSSLVECGHRKAVNPRRGGEQGINGYHTGSTDARSNDAIAIASLHHLTRRGHVGRRELGKRFFLETGPRLDLYRNERRAVANRTSVILVARRLMNADLLA